MYARSSTFAVIGVAILALAGCDSDKDKPRTTTPPPAEATPTHPETPLTREDSVMVEVTAPVRAVDRAARTLTLQGARGSDIVLNVPPQVTRFNEVQVGDNVRTRFSASLLAELRPPTADETATPVAVIASGESSRDGANPVGARSRAVRVVTTVDAVDYSTMRVTLRGPMGDVTTVKGRKPENVRRIKVGDTIVITYTEAMVVELEKVSR